MSKYKGKNGKPNWVSRSGQFAARDKGKRDQLIKAGILPPFNPTTTVDEAIEEAGL